MLTLSAKRVRVALGLLGVLGVVGWLALAAQPLVEPVLAARVLPIIDAELERGPWQGMLPDGRWFCVERVIEIRRTGDELAVGIDAWCEQYARDGDALVEGSGEHGPKVVYLAAGSAGHRVVRVDVPPDGAGFTPWVERNFSTTKGLGESYSTREEPAAQARAAFGLPPDAVIQR